jgi:Restriction endonuclease
MKKRTISLKLRFEIFERDGYKCVVCGRSASDGIKLQVDHIHPFSKGGLSEKSNLATLCHECNIGKGNKVFGNQYLETRH